MADIRIKDLPLATGPTAPTGTDSVAIDGLTTRKTTISALGDVAVPIASQAEAEAGVNATKRMTPLTTKQSIASEVGVTLASKAQGDLADTSVQPSDLGNSASLNVGTTSGTVAAGNDSRLLLASTALQSGAASSNINFINTLTGAATRTVQDWMRDVARAKDYGVVGDGTTVVTTQLSRMVTNEIGYSTGRVIDLGPGVYVLNDLNITGNNIVIRGVGKDKTVLKPGTGAVTNVLNITSATNVTVMDLTIDTTGRSIRNVSIDRNSQSIRFTHVGFVGNLNGDLVYNEGDVTTFEDPYVFATSANTWFINFSKDAASTGLPFAGNNHKVVGGSMGGGSGAGGQGIRITQYNGTGTARRVEGVLIQGFIFISNGASAIQIGNSLYVQVADCIIDQFSNAGITIQLGADQATIQNNYIGSIPPTTNKVGVFIAKNAGKMTDISGNTFGNLDYAVQVLADASNNVTDVGVVNNRSWFITVQPYYFDSVTKLVFMGNRDQSTAPNGTVGTAQTRSANTGVFVGNIMNSNNPAPYGTVTSLKFSANIGPTGFYGN